MNKCHCSIKGKLTCRDQILQALTEVIDDTMQVFDFGAKKHPDEENTPNFLLLEGNKCQLEVRGKSILGHAAKCYMDVGAKDDESDLPHLLHLISSAAILYIRHKRGIKHPEDKNEL